MSRRAAVYARISETGRDRDKTADQVAQARRLAERRGYDVVAEFVDDGISALGGKQRPGWDALLDAILARRFDVILATEEERFARNVKDKAELQAVCIEAGVVWETERDGYVDPASESGEFFSTMRAAMGRMESRRKAARQKAANSERASEGRPAPGRRRYGYEVDGVTPREAEAAVVRRMFAHVAEGGSIRSQARALAAEGVDPSPGRSWSAGRVRYILSNPAYGGELRRFGQALPSTVIVAIVDPAQAAEVRAILADEARTVTPGPKPRYLASGLAECGLCGSRMFNLARAYRCKDDASHPTIKRETLDARLRREIALAFLSSGRDLLSGESAANLAPLLEALRRNEAAATQTAADRDEQLLTPAAARERLVELRDLRLAIEAQLDAARAERSASSALADVAAELLGDRDEIPLGEFFGPMVDAVVERFEALDIDRQRDTARALLDVTVAPGRDNARRVRVDHRLALHLNPDVEIGTDDDPRHFTDE